MLFFDSNKTRSWASTSTAWMALSPKTVIQKKIKRDGARSTPTTNSLIVRPREIRAMNIPTKGAQAIHQAQ